MEHLHDLLLTAHDLLNAQSWGVVHDPLYGASAHSPRAIGVPPSGAIYASFPAAGIIEGD